MNSYCKKFCIIHQDALSVTGIKTIALGIVEVKAIGKRETCSRCWGMQDLPPELQVGIKTLCETHSEGSKALCSAALAVQNTVKPRTSL